MSATDPEDLIALLGLEPHPEGGHYVETWRSPGAGRATSTAIYYLLRAGERSHWHRVDADEIWLHHGGEGLILRTSSDGRSTDEVVLGSDLAGGHRPQAVVPAGHWQAARPLGAWVLVSCVVAPGFEFDGFTLAPEGWEPTPD